MRRKKLMARVMPAIMAASMVMSLCPTTALAVSGEQVAKDGTYTATSHVVNNPEDENAWKEYDVTVSLKVEDGKFSDITVEPGRTYDSAQNDSYFLKAYAKTKGIATLLKGKEATEDTISGWNTVSGATCSSKAIKEAALKAIQEAEEVQAAPVIVTTELETAIQAAGEKKAADYTVSSWKTMQEKLTEAQAVLENKENQSQTSIDSAAKILNDAVNALTLRAADTSALVNAINSVDDLREELYTAASWQAMQDKLTAAKNMQAAVEKDASDIPQTSVTGAANELDAAIKALAEKEYTYVLMNIPYDKYYAADLNNDVKVDVFTSATKAKTRTGTLAGGSYHKADGTEITGITFPVKVSNDDLAALKNYEQVTDEDSVEIIVSNRGQTNRTVYEGKEALFEKETYSYYVLNEVPEFYKEMTVNADGSFSFGEISGSYQTKTIEVTDQDVVFKTESQYGDYELDFDEEMIEQYFSHDTDKIYGVIVGTTEGSEYGLRHLENIWLGCELSWCTGFTESVHNCPTDSKHYKAMMGQHINKVIYYTSKGVFEFNFGEDTIYVPEKFSENIGISNTKLSDGKTTITSLSDLPASFEADYSVRGLKDVSVSDDGTLTYSTEGAVPGQYTLTISDKSGKYADITKTFVLTTDEMPAAYNGEDDNAALQAAKDFDAEDLNNYIANITSVSVNGKAYAASGKRPTVIINRDGTLNTSADPFSAPGSYEIEVTATGYDTPLTFTYNKSVYVLLNIPYDEYYAADLNNDVKVDVFTSATKAKTRTGTLAGGSYHKADGTEITGITFPVKISADNVAAWEALKNYEQVTDEDSVEIIVSNRGQTNRTVYEGKEALFEKETYSYYVLNEVPEFYKEMTVNTDGSFSFGAISGSYQTKTIEVTDQDVVFKTESQYGDYELDFDEEMIEEYFSHDTDKIYGVIVGTTEGSEYGLRHLENIWLGCELSWCTGFTEAVHNCPTDSEHYKAMMGQHINKVTYYTSKGVFEFNFGEDTIYVPKKFDNEISVSDAALSTGTTMIGSLSDLPEDYAAEYKVNGLKSAKVEDGVLTFDPEEAVPGQYTLTISDENGIYANILTTFVLTTEDMPAIYNEDINNPAVVKAEDFTDEDFNNYIANIASVSVNGKDYSASGKRPTVIINQDGTLNTSAAPFAEGDKFEIVISSTGYSDMSFTYYTFDTVELQNVIDQAQTLEESDYTADSWKDLQTALEHAKEALEAKESGKAVDAATAELQSAINNLKKNVPADNDGNGTSGDKNNGNGNGISGDKNTGDGNGTSNVDNKGGNGNAIDKNSKGTADSGKKTATVAKKSVKTGDPSAILGLFAAAASSAGIGGLSLRLKRRSKKEEE